MFLNEIVYYGIQLNEFIKYVPVEMNQLLLLEAEYFGTGFRSKTKFEIVDKDEMSNFLNEDIYNYGDFCWIDFNKRENDEKLEPSEIVELLYLGHMFKPVKSPFFNKIKIGMDTLHMMMDGFVGYNADNIRIVTR